MEVTVTGGADDLAELGKRLKAAGSGGKGLRKELSKRIRDEAKPTIAKVKANARTTLPSRGGLAARVARSRISTRTTTQGRNVGVKITGRDGYNIRAMNEGTVRKPLFGNRSRWYTQAVPKGWFSDPIEDDAKQFRDAAGRAIKDIRDRIER